MTASNAEVSTRHAVSIGELFKFDWHQRGSRPTIAQSSQLIHGYAEMSSLPNLVLFARYPIAGECKTRLIPAVGAKGAAEIHRDLAGRTAKLLCQSGCPFTVAMTGGGEGQFRDWLGSGIEFVPQPKGNLGDRLLAFVGRAPVIFFGADTPDLSSAHIAAAVEGLKTHPVVIGPAEDGGYYLIGMREPVPQLLTDMPWSTAQVLPETLRRCSEMGLEPLMLQTLSDCDRPEDLDRWPELRP